MAGTRILTCETPLYGREGLNEMRVQMKPDQINSDVKFMLEVIMKRACLESYTYCYMYKILVPWSHTET